jgi:prepilin-type N-terminal cleavage/methylation domain-containing protein
MKEHLKAAISDVVSKRRIWDLVIAMFITSFALLVLFGGLVEDRTTQAIILGSSGAVILVLTAAIGIVIKAIIHKKKHETRLNQKGFTLVELIVVIAVVAILIAAVAPAALGVINRAQRTADESDARHVLTAATLITIGNNGTIPAQEGENNFQERMENELSGGNLVTGALFTVHIQDSFPVSVVLTTNARSNGTVTVGTNPVPTGDGVTTRTFTAP